MKKLYTLIISGTLMFNAFGQSDTYTIYTSLLSDYVNAIKSPFKTKSVDVFKLKADSIVYYNDSLENAPVGSFVFSYLDTEISIVKRFYNEETGKMDNDSKHVFFLDNTLPVLEYEPAFESSSGSKNSYEYYFSYSIGDTLNLRYTWDTLTNNWVTLAKTRHFVSDAGIDTLAQTYTWDSENKSWTLNNVTKQHFKKGENDSIYFTMYFPNIVDKIRDLIYVYHYNEKNQLVMKDEYNEGYLEIDSFIYNSNGDLVFENQRNYTGYNYAYDNRYDENRRKTSIYNWVKETNQSEYVFDGSYFLYYPITDTISQPDTNTTQPVINSTDKESELYRVFPTPAYNSITISNYQGQVKIINLSGQVLIEKTVDFEEPIFVGELLKGIYLVGLEDGETRLTIKE